MIPPNFDQKKEGCKQQEQHTVSHFQKTNFLYNQNIIRLKNNGLYQMMMTQNQQFFYKYFQANFLFQKQL